MPRKKKEVATLDQFSESSKKEEVVEKPKKIRKLRKPMSEEQREAMAQRLKEAREKRALENPPEYKNVHSSVLAKSEDSTLNVQNVKEWIKFNREKIKELNKTKRDDKYAEAKINSVKGYIALLDAYLKTGDWYGMYCGENEDQLATTYCVAQAFYPDGMPKRSVGVFYPEIGERWTQEMDNEYRQQLEQE